MATFVLVHGAYHGGWCWRKTATILRLAGHVVYTPTLTGLGERTHLASRETTLDTHIQDIASILEFEDLDPVILIGHSYGGFVVSGVAEKVPERLRLLVFVDALIPHDGASAGEQFGPDALAALQRAAEVEGHGWLVPITVGIPDPATATSIFGVTKEADLKWMREKLNRFHPLACFTQKIRLGRHDPSIVPRFVIECVQPGQRGRATQQAKLAREARWGYHQIVSGHDVMIAQPRRLASALCSLAGSGGGVKREPTRDMSTHRARRGKGVRRPS